MRLTIADAVLDRFPDTFLGVVVLRGIDNAGESAALARRLETAQAAIPERFRDMPVAEHPSLAVWREAYRRFGASPKEHRSSIENLVRRVLKGNPLPSVNRLVDLCNAVSLEALLPAGTEDLDAIDGDVELAVAGENEPSVRLLGEPEARPPRPGEVIYRDRAGALCRRWNWTEAERTKVTERTRNALVVLESLPPIPAEAVRAAAETVVLLSREQCGGEARTAWLDRSEPGLTL